MEIQPSKMKETILHILQCSFGMDYVILFCFGKTHYRCFFKRYLFAFLDNIYFVENKYVMHELLYNIEIYVT